MMFKRLTDLFRPHKGAEETSQWVYVQCNRCGEIMQTRINLRNDLSVQYGESGEITGYYCCKVLTGSARCFQRIEVELWFDVDQRVIDRHISGGTFLR